MTDDNLPAVPEPPSREVATLDTDSWVEVAKPIFALASRIYDTDFVPKGLRGSEPATAAAMLYGREIGLPPMTSLGGIHVIEGKPGLSAEQMRAMVFAAGHEIEFTESTGATCTIRGRRRGQERWTQVIWTVDMARAAGLGNRPIWKSYPRTQLQARATTELCRMIFPDVIHGFRSVEELDDMGEADGAAPGGGASSGSTKVSRRRTTKRAASAARGEIAAAKGSLPASDAPAGPPLPGEPGYEDTPQTTGGGAESGVGNDSATRDADTSGEAPDASHAPPSVPQDDPDLPTEGKQGSPTTRRSAPRATQTSSSTGRDPDAGPSTGEKDPPSARETRPEADGGTPGRQHPTGPRKLSRAQQRMLMAEFSGFGMADDREERLLAVTTIVGREVESTNDLTADEASTLIDTLAKVKDRAGLNRLLDEYDAAKIAQAEQDATDEAAKGDES